MKHISVYFTSLLLATFCISCEEENSPPSCEITNPQSTAEYDIGDEITISVEAEDEDGAIVEVKFYINDIGVASASSFPYNYQWNTLDEKYGTQKIKVSAIDENGAVTEDTISILLKGLSPVAAFSADTTKIIEGESIQFNDQSTNEPASWLWDFGDESISAEQNPIHTYSSVGYFTVSLTVSNVSGSNTETKINYITSYSNLETGTFTDARDGKTYKTVSIGSQVWMAENLNYETSDGSWAYDEILSNANIYGRLYTLETAKIACPSGWHLPSDNEWKQLEMAIGMSQSEADNKSYRGTDEALKLKSTSGWERDGNGTDEYGFAVLPGGLKAREYRGGDFSQLGYLTAFWTSTPDSTDTGWTRGINYFNENVKRTADHEETSLSVRCVED